MQGRLPTCYSPVRRSCTPKGLTARLACVKHAASVRPEPGSNSPIRFCLIETSTNWHIQSSLTISKEPTKGFIHSSTGYYSTLLSSQRTHAHRHLALSSCVQGPWCFCFACVQSLSGPDSPCQIGLFLPISWGSSRSSLTLPEFLSGFVRDPLASVSVLPCGTWRTLAVDPSRFQIGPLAYRFKIHHRRSGPCTPSPWNPSNTLERDHYDRRHTASSQR